MQGKANNAKSLSFWQTEHKCGNYPWMGGKGPPAPNDMAYANESWGLIKAWITTDKVNAYSAWNMVLDPNGDGNDSSRAWYQNALLVVNGGEAGDHADLLRGSATSRSSWMQAPRS